jgi:hypothetical protein
MNQAVSYGACLVRLFEQELQMQQFLLIALGPMLPAEFIVKNRKLFSLS